MLAILSYIALLLFELAYILFVFDPETTRTQAGLMLIFAFEIAFAVRVARAQIRLKGVSRSLLYKSRAYAAVYVFGMITVMAFGLGLWPFSGEQFLLAAAFAVIASAKLSWEHQFGTFAQAGAKSENGA